ncbi:hypothetical protein OEV98_06000 [Caldibacillus lycopersici]|uniref:Uncharacterized protein n=1 Tax=Perspicuibacillus lycopersici TaxID=1325689 RepID=A0AAE3IRH9_9BACI|nr:hypothetical protein [Perspicuibacillus lycopersici]MCU9613102.1 hypothetical protein [Perspicuibacillus lycopersici]
MAIFRNSAIVVLLCLVGLWYFGYFDKPEDTVAKFGDSVNSLDLDGILETLNPEETKQVRAVSNLLGTVSEAISGVNVVDTIVPLLPSLVGYVDENSDGSMPKLDFEFLHTDMNLLRTEATVEANVQFTDENGNTEEQACTIYLEKQDRKWYIMDMVDQ